MSRLLLLATVLVLASPLRCTAEAPRSSTLVGGPCDGCDLLFEGMPRELSWRTTVAGKEEPGEPLEMRGVIYQRDGRTPAPGVILYVYHTDAKGYYSPAPGQTRGRRNGHLRGWMKTDARGRYEFRTIRPAPYPSRDNPAHIHVVVKEPGKNEYYLDEYVFADDPLLTPERRSKLENRGGSGIVALSRNQDGVWTGRRDLILGRNIPNYP
ncbi:MAG TPA: intradiol ring-cleavage dioxygenase [Thermoanaerobaculia bacterium]|jgi:protocatechuate 3,4-dioxygenase beta subunit|nr:intradiol ring-cleavage dioxygenase [Thermoanaerobaculia bacterium]